LLWQQKLPTARTSRARRKAGEFGFPDRVEQQVEFRADHLNISTSRELVIMVTGLG
jgi:hypothetical protein